MKKFYARLFNSGGELDCIEADSVFVLYARMVKEWPQLEDGDTIKIEHI